MLKIGIRFSNTALKSAVRIFLEEEHTLVSSKEKGCDLIITDQMPEEAPFLHTVVVCLDLPNKRRLQGELDKKGYDAHMVVIVTLAGIERYIDGRASRFAREQLPAMALSA